MLQMTEPKIMKKKLDIKMFDFFLIDFVMYLGASNIFKTIPKYV